MTQGSQGILPPKAETPSAVSVCPLVTLTKRADFVKASKAKYQGTKGLTLQARPRGDGDPQIRVGYTCSKKVGNAVARNAAKRRLREIARIVLPQKGLSGYDYVLIGRKDTTETRDFKSLQSDLIYALKRLHPSSD